MKAAAARAFDIEAAHGTSLIDALVGLAVALVATVVVYQAFVAVDTVRRNGAVVADAQANAALALFTLALHVGNAGAGWTNAARWLDTCPADADVRSSLRPVTVLITDGGADDRPDTLVVRRSFARALATPVAIAAAASAGTTVLRAESPDGFDVGDRVIAVTRSGACASMRVEAVGPPAGGIVDVTHTAVPIDLPATTILLDLGPAARASTLRFDVNGQTLRSTDVANDDAPVPLASNVVNVKFQYGIDSDGDGGLDTWVRADASGPWSPATLLTAPYPSLARIKAVRMGIIVRGERVDRALARDFHWVLFDCADEDKSRCPGRLQGSITGSANGSYRYRVVETIVPLRNVMWNREP